MPLLGGLMGGAGRSSPVGAIDPDALRAVGSAMLGNPTYARLLGGGSFVRNPGLVGGVLGTGMPLGPTGSPVAPPVSSAPEFYAEVERQMLLDPAGTLMRHFPVKVLGGAISGGVVTFSPARRCIPLRLCIPRAQGAGTIANIQIALQPVNTVSTTEPAGSFAEDTYESAWLPPIVCDVGQKITANVASVTSAGLWVAEIDRGTILPPTSFLMRAPFSQTITHGSAANQIITVSPQKKMRLRRILIDVASNTNSAKMPVMTITSINCGVDPQMDSADPIPLTMFDDKVALGFMDGDVVVPGQSFTITCVNPDAMTDVVVTGSILGDTV